MDTTLLTTRRASGLESSCEHAESRKPTHRTTESPFVQGRGHARRSYCPLVHYDTVEEYAEHFSLEYCLSPLTTFDGLSVIFVPYDFEHAFYGDKAKQQFAWERAERIDWIGKALRDPLADLHVGWTSSIEQHDSNRRVCLVGGDYLVAIRFVEPGVARFITAYPATGDTLRKTKASPRW